MIKAEIKALSRNLDRTPDWDAAAAELVGMRVKRLQIWINDRHRRDILVTSDIVWKKIRKTWGHMSRNNQEAIFQGVKL